MTRLYRPSNGTEGMFFEAAFCDRCWKNNGKKGCGILNRVYALGIEDKGYPKQMTYDAEGKPTCTAFEEKRPKPKPKQKPMPLLALFLEEKNDANN